MSTTLVRKEDVQRKWYVLDAADKPLGRTAEKAAVLLRGKNKPTFTPNADTGDFVIVVNCDKVVLTGRKLEQKIKRHHTQYMGGMKEVKYDKYMAEKSDEAVYEAVKGMLPKNSLGRKMLKKLRVYKGAEYKEKAQKPEAFPLQTRY